MNILDLGDTHIHWREDGDPDGAPVVFSNSLGSDLRMWDKIVPLMPAGLRLIRYDTRGHGLSACPAGAYAMGALIRDAERFLDALSVRDCAFVGLSMGGLIAQGLAVKRLDLVRAMVLSNTAAKIGTAQTWAERIASVRADGLESIAGTIMERWFSRTVPRHPGASGLAHAFPAHAGRWLCRLLGRHRRDGFHHADLGPDAAHAGNCRVRGRIDAPRPRARDGGSGARQPLSPDPRRGPSAPGREARRIRRDPWRLPARHRPHGLRQGGAVPADPRLLPRRLVLARDDRGAGAAWP